MSSPTVNIINLGGGKFKIDTTSNSHVSVESIHECKYSQPISAPDVTTSSATKGLNDISSMLTGFEIGTDVKQFVEQTASQICKPRYASVTSEPSLGGVGSSFIAPYDGNDQTLTGSSVLSSESSSEWKMVAEEVGLEYLPSNALSSGTVSYRFDCTHSSSKNKLYELSLFKQTPGTVATRVSGTSMMFSSDDSKTYPRNMGMSGLVSMSASDKIFVRVRRIDQDGTTDSSHSSDLELMGYNWTVSII